jgi:hypothetical protein
MNNLIGMAIVTSMVALAGFVIYSGHTPFISQFAWAQATAGDTNSSSSGNPAVFPPDSQTFGLSYAEWTTKWWQWAYSIPTTNNPILDQTGKDCAQSQNQTGPVWFLAGTGGGSAERTCTIPAGKAILLPIVNSLNLRTAGESNEELLTAVKERQDKVTTLEASIDGTPLQNLSSYRIQSPFFEVTLPDDNIVGEAAGTYLSVSDGNWLFLKPLPPGQHEIRTHGTIIDPTSPTPSFETAVTYHLTIQ